MAYTVGLASTWQRPETVVFGLPRDVSVPLLDDVAARVAGGETFRAGRDYYGLLQEYPVRSLPVASDTAALWMPIAARYHGDLSALQLLWRDFRGRFLATMQSQPIIAPPDVDP